MNWSKMRANMVAGSLRSRIRSSKAKIIRNQTPTSLQLESLEPRLLLNGTAATMSRIDTLQAAPISLTGDGITIFEWDGGQVWTSHTDFTNDGTNHVIVADPGAQVLNEHATHVAGTMIGQGQNPAAGGNAAGAAGGMAPGATVMNYDFNGWVGEQLSAAAQKGALLSNNSWGNAAGWSTSTKSDGTTEWRWYGKTSVNVDEDYKFGWYGTEARVLDIICYQNPYYTSVRSSGNDANDRGPAAGTEYYDVHSGDNKVYDGAHPTPDGILQQTDGAGNTSFAYDTIGHPATSKNSITVGAINDDSTAPFTITTTTFSGRGPTDDGRIKPDIVANGSSLYSTDFALPATGPAIQDVWSNKSGTSMATPTVTGGLALLQDYFSDLYPNTYMRSDTLKALSIHSAQDDTVVGPDYATGWGLFNALGAYNIIKADNDTTDHIDDMQTLTYAGDTIEIPLYSTGTSPVKVTIAWNDPPGDESPEALNNPTSRLKNDLDMTISTGRGGAGSATTHQAWTLNPANPTAVATKNGNHRDNVEQVVIDSPGAGWYTINISDTTMAKDTQDFTIIIEGLEDRPELHGTSMTVDQRFFNRGQDPLANDSGARINSTFQIVNAGTEKVDTPFDVRFYLSQDQTIDPSTDIPLDILVPDPNSPEGYSPASNQNNYIHNDVVLPGEVISVNILLDPPKEDPFNPAGGSTVYVGYVVDTASAINESDETNNRNRGIGMDIGQSSYWPTPQGALSIEPNDLSVMAGGTTNNWDMHVEVSRDGDEMEIYLHISDTPDPLSEPPGSDIWWANLHMGDSSGWPGAIDIDEVIAPKPKDLGGYEFTIPSTDYFSTDMDYYMTVYVTYLNDEEWSEFFLVGEPVPVHWAPDVSFKTTGNGNSLTDNVPKDMQFGYPIYDIAGFGTEQVGVNWDIRSIRADVPGGSPIQFNSFLQDPPDGLSIFDSFYGMESFQVGADSYNGGIDRDGATVNPTGTVSLSALPEIDPFGTVAWNGAFGPTPYYLNLNIDKVEIPNLNITENNVFNNSYSHAVVYYPDLTGVSFDVQVASQGGASPFVPEQATVNFALQSKYGVAFPNWDINFYLSGDETIDPASDTHLGTYRVEDQIAPDGILSDTIILPIDEQWMSAWHDYTIGMVIDYKSDTNYPEHDDFDDEPRANNLNVGLLKDKSTIYLSRVADYKWVQASVATTQEVQWGDDIAVNVEVKNDGPTTADPVEATVYLWTDPYAKYELGNFPINGLSAGAGTGNQQYSFTLPNEPLPFIDLGKDVYLDVYIDEDNAFEEVFENNNSAWSLGAPMTVSFATPDSLFVTSHTIDPAQSSNVSHVDVTFNAPINAATFTNADVSITGPGGNVSINNVSHVTGNTYRVAFDSAQTTSGAYSITVGASISDTKANLMDQDNDGIAGELLDDQYVGDFVIVQPALSYAITSKEQQFIYLLNRARSNPQAYEDEVNLPDGMLTGVEAQPPLAINELLVNSAIFHAEEMAENDYFAHQSEVTGDWPNKMAIDAGYNLPFNDSYNGIESIAAGYGNLAPETPDGALRMLIEDEGVNPPGHRQHLLGIGGWSQHTEIGAGFANNNSAYLRNYWAIHSAYENTTDVFLTGVVYDDKNDNQLYDKNEGLGNVAVSIDQGASTTTNDAGGWTIPVTAGTYIVSASGGSFNGTGSVVVIVDDDNIEVDFLSGEALGIVDFGLDTGSSLPKVSIAATDSQAAENNLETATFTVTRTGDTDEAMTVSYSVSGTAQSPGDFDTLTGSVIISAGETSAIITISPVDDDDIEGQETVTLTLQASLDYQFGDTTSDTANIDDDEGAIVAFGDGIAKSVTFTDSDLTAGRVSLKSATGMIVFIGDGLVVENGKSSVKVIGSAEISDINVVSSSVSASLGFSAKGGADGFIDVDNITINGSAKDIKGKALNLNGDLTVTGGLLKLDLNNVADQHLISVGPVDSEKGSLSIKLKEVANLSIESQSPIKSLSALNWVDDDATADMITAPGLGKLTVTENFPAGITLTDSSTKYTLGTVKVGNITGGTWDVNGNGGKVKANSISENWSATYSGDLAGITTKQDLGGNITARSIKSVSVKGDYANGNMALTLESADPKVKALGKISVSGSLSNVDISSKSTIGGVTLGLFIDSNIFAGISDLVSTLPSLANDFDSDVSIDKFKLKGSKIENIWMSNSNIAAARLGSVSIGYAQTNNGDVPFGIATSQFKSIAYQDSNVKIKAKKLDDIVNFDNLDNLLVRIID